MIRNFFKVAYRNLLRKKGFSIINISGLAIGMASAILIFLWIQNEISYDKFHMNKDRLYEVWNKAEFSGKLNAWNTTPKVLARTMEKDLPEVEQAVRVHQNANYLFSIGEKSMIRHGFIVDSGFLKLFSFPMLKGNLQTALDNRHTVVLTEKFAKSLFGKEDPVGKVLQVEDTINFTVTGVLKDLPNNTRFDFDYLMPWSFLRELGEDDNYWGNNSTRTYVLLRKNATLASIAPKMKVFKAKYQPEEPKWEMFLYPLERWRLYSSFTDGHEDGGKITFVRLFGIIAIFILLIACINFMNLSTARSEKRAKEVGIRKVVGASKGSLVGQFIGESILIALMSGIIALLLVQLTLPAYNHLTGKQLFIDYKNPLFWVSGLGFVLFTGLIAGSYPAFFLSSFTPVKVLKGTFKKVNTLVTPRKVLVILQFTFAIILIICTIIVKQQIDYAKDRELGYNKYNLVYHFLTGDINKNYQLIRDELVSSGVASSVTKTSAPLTDSWSDGWGQEWEGKDPNDKTDFFRYVEDGGLGKTAGLQFISGRDIDLNKYPGDSLSMVINESALKVFKFKEPLGQIVKDNDESWKIVGVIKDFILTSPYQPTRPMLIYGPKLWFNVILIRTNENQSTAKNLKGMETIFKKYNPQYPFDYRFMDEEYARKFENEKRTGTLAALFAALTIFISCLGLFGLATYMAENRIREIGLRKVLGASVSSITTLLSMDFLKLVFVSLLIAIPISWWGMHNWLQNYEYRVSIQWWVFALAGIMSIAIACLTVSYESIKAALANPIKSLRTE